MSRKELETVVEAYRLSLKTNPHDFLIESVELLGSEEKIDFTRTDEALEINLRAEAKNDLPICFKIAIG